MNAAWHVIWWVTAVNTACVALLLMANADQSAKTGAEMVGARVISLIVGLCWLWLMSVSAPPWLAAP
jgi:hypothetical protein